ncbi:SET domain-containing protein [Histomonas meleagridis]|uniref:SET domain-containing protein n=1 Tax=Histomonas meleagridis TaxID=135588 RepID=UPI00355A3DD7|nr:SET domain-containing protein [Histomonas meleagridis]KAH0804243.1 SET domain-containing protein [Histomonas meleagridis]
MDDSLPHLTREEKQRFSLCSYYANLLKNSSFGDQTNTEKRKSTVVKELSRSTSENFLFDCDKLSRKALRFEISDIDCWGVFADEPIQKGEPIIEYIGEVIRQRVVEKREKEYELEGNHGSYIFRIDDDNNIDATHSGGLARYINHSCDPNCETRIIPFDKTKRVVIFAKRNISPCEELSYDYQLPYEIKEKAIRCTCHSPNCKGWLNWKQDQDEIIRRNLNIGNDAPFEPDSETDEETKPYRKHIHDRNEKVEKMKRERQLVSDIHVLIPSVEIDKDVITKTLGLSFDDEDDEIDEIENKKQKKKKKGKRRK